MGDVSGAGGRGEAGEAGKKTPDSRIHTQKLQNLIFGYPRNIQQIN
ncbi:hypothetical protein [Anabaena sp. 4-3]|nr:hypothetical protein [Anabaena sp. 4-3]